MLLEALQDPLLHHHQHDLCGEELSLHSPGSTLPSPCSSHPASLLPSPAYTPSAQSYNTYFQFPPHGGTHYIDNGIAVKEEPWSLPSLELPPMGPSAQESARSNNLIAAADSYSPMLMSPAQSNLNTPRVSLSSHHSDFSGRLRSCHSSLQCSPHASPLGFAPWEQGGGLGGFGHSLAGFHDLSGPANMDMSSSSPPIEAVGYITPPRSGYSSPLREEREPADEETDYNSFHMHAEGAPPSYHQTLHHQMTSCYSPYMGGPESPYLPPPYPYDGTDGGPPAYTPDPESSLVSERDQEPPDTPDSSVKEEPSEDINEDGAAICRYACTVQ